MQVTEVRLTKREGDDSQLAFGSITFDGDFVVSGIKVMKRKDGALFVGYPSRKSQNGEYKDVCFPMTKALREDITIAVLAKYESLE